MQNHNQFFSDNTQFEINSLSNDRSRLPPAPINTNIQDLSYNDLGILGSSFQMQSTPLARRSNVSARRSEGPGFLQTTQLTEILTADGEQFHINILPRMEGGFFVNEDKWTCYRRNYFRVLTTFQLTSSKTPEVTAGNMKSIGLLAKNGSRLFSIQSFEMVLSARTNITSKRVNLVKHRMKRTSADDNMEPPICKIMPGGHLSVAPPTSSHSIENFDENMTDFVNVDRLQFRQATANNGKRRAIQQFFQLCVEIYAICDNNERVKIAECESEDLVVRGRSPGHYSDLDRLKERKQYADQFRRNIQSEIQTPFLSNMSTPLLQNQVVQGNGWGNIVDELQGYTINSVAGTPDARMLMDLQSNLKENEIVEVIDIGDYRQPETISTTETEYVNFGSGYTPNSSTSNEEFLNSANSILNSNDGSFSEQSMFLLNDPLKDMRMTPIKGNFEDLFQ